MLFSERRFTGMKKAKGRYELMAMKTGDFMGKTEVLAEMSLDELKTIKRIAKALANDKSGVLLKTVKKHVKFWETPRDTSVDWLFESCGIKLGGRKTAKRGGRQ